MRWKFWQPAKSEAELSLEQLQAGAATSQPAPAGEPPASPARSGSSGPGVGGPLAASDFRMTVVDVFSITGRGTVVTGQVEAGTVSRGQRVVLTTTDGSAREVEVTGVEAFRRLLETASAGDNIGLLLKGVKKDDIARGDVLTG